MIGLARLLDAPVDAECPVAFGREGQRDLAALRRDTGRLSAALEPHSGRPLLLHCDDAYAFAVGLLAALRVGCTPLVPPSRQPGVLEALAPEVSGALLDGDEASQVLGDLPQWHPLRVETDAELPARPLQRDAVLATLFTSGTTGRGARVEKRLRHLEDEIVELERRFGPVLGEGPAPRILTTVGPQHLYGLLFRVLWPLSAGRPFQRVAALHPEELRPHTGSGAFAVVTTPSALRHLVARGGLAERARDCRAVFCSGGPLTLEGSREAAAVVGSPPFEVYGSTETGGVATRQQRSGDEPWELLGGVELAVDAESGCAAVASPFVSEGEMGPTGVQRFVTGDRVDIDAQGRFRLLGRADRVIKVGEKRLDLNDLEARLLEHPAVAEAALLALDGPAGETRVGAVLRPSARSWAVLEAGGQRALAKVLSEFLAPHCDRVFLPRAWRLVAALPRNAQGKLPRQSLLRLFERDAPSRAPERLAARREGQVLSLRLRIPVDLAFFEGHFPGQPVVAGSVELHFAMRALEELLGEPPHLERLEALKFHERLGPGEELSLVVSLDEPSGRFEFSLADAEHPERLFASGRGWLVPKR